MTDKIISTGSTVQLLLSQKGVQAMLTLMIVGASLVMLIIGREIPSWLMGLVFGCVGLWFEVPGASPKLPANGT